MTIAANIRLEVDASATADGEATNLSFELQEGRLSSEGRAIGK